MPTIILNTYITIYQHKGDVSPENCKLWDRSPAYSGYTKQSFTGSVSKLRAQ
jgi:hypothetical protein